MSYIKSAFVIDGMARIVEVHGATWLYLDVQAYAKHNARHYRRLARELSTDDKSLREFYMKNAQDYSRYAKDPSYINSGLAQDICKRGLSPISDSNIKEWARFLSEEDILGHADNSDEPPAVLANFDVNRFYDTERNFYATYEDTLPEGWKYERIMVNRMVEILEENLASQDIPRLGKL